MKRTRIAATILAIGCLSALAGCTAAAQATDGPAEFQQRDPLPSCGSVELEQGERLSDESIDCLDGAGAGGAELIVVAPTTEGDPITSYYRALPGGGMEIFYDLTEDRFGAANWTLVTCPDAVAYYDMGDCTEEPLG